MKEKEFIKLCKKEGVELKDLPFILPTIPKESDEGLRKFIKFIGESKREEKQEDKIEELGWDEHMTGVDVWIMCKINEIIRYLNN